MKFTQHAKDRLLERTKLWPSHIKKKFHESKCIPIGVDEKKCEHYLMYCEKSDTPFITILDPINQEVVTFLFIDYHENIAWQIDYNLIAEIKKIELGEVPIIELPQPKKKGQAFTDPTTLRVMVLYYMENTTKPCQHVFKFNLDVLQLLGLQTDLKDQPNLQKFLESSSEFLQRLAEVIREKEINLIDVYDVRFKIGHKGYFFDVNQFERRLNEFR